MEQSRTFLVTRTNRCQQDQRPALFSPTMSSTPEGQSFSALTAQQKKSGLAAWLGWMFDGLDMHLYTLVALPFVAELLNVARSSPEASMKASIIQAAFLVGWATGGA